MAQLKQIQIRYIPLEDRLLLRINTADGDEFRFWLTRRYVLLLFPAVQKILASDPDIQLQRGEEQRQAVLSFQHESALANADFATEYEDQYQSLPLGEEPVLLARLQARHDGGSHVLSLRPETGQGIDLTFNEQMLHGMGKLLADAIGQANWGINVTAPGQIVPEIQVTGSGSLN